MESRGSLERFQGRGAWTPQYRSHWPASAGRLTQYLFWVLFLGVLLLKNFVAPQPGAWRCIDRRKGVDARPRCDRLRRMFYSTRRLHGIHHDVAISTARQNGTQG